MPRKAKPSGNGQGFKGRTHILLVWDESGSMGHLQQAGVDAFNEQLEAAQSGDGEALFSFSLFGTQYEPKNVRQVHVEEPAKSVVKLTTAGYKPSGGTPLYDAVGISLREIEPKVKSDDRGLCVIFTDGHENSSREWTEDSLGKLIKELTDQGNWTFVFAAAGVDAWAAARNLHIPQANTLSVAASGAGMKAMSAMSAGSTLDYMASPESAAGSFYSPPAQVPVKDREAAKSEKKKDERQGK